MDVRIRNGFDSRSDVGVRCLADLRSILILTRFWRPRISRRLTATNGCNRDLSLAVGNYYVLCFDKTYQQT
jgi:hypothetical protein